MPRFYCPVPLQVGQRVSLPDAVTRHAIGALRLREGDAVTLFNGDGYEYDGVLAAHASLKEAGVQLLASQLADRESPLRVTLAQGISSGDRMDITLQKSVEMGVMAIQPLNMRRSIVRLSGDKLEKRRAHWQAVVVSACEQCGRNVVPEVLPILDFADWRRAQNVTSGLLLLLDPEAESSLPNLNALERGSAVTLLAGPEGGFDPVESTMAKAAGFVGVRLGPRVLRTETAALAALAAMQVLWGDYR